MIEIQKIKYRVKKRKKKRLMKLFSYPFLSNFLVFATFYVIMYASSLALISSLF